MEVEEENSDVIIHGLVNLIESQCQLAQSFGISHERFFGETIHNAFVGHDVTQVITQWCQNPQLHNAQLKQLFAHLQIHQLALVQSIDSVAIDALDGHFKTGEKTTSKFGLWFGWLKHRAKHRAHIKRLLKDQTYRFGTLLAPSFLRGYDRMKNTPTTKQSGDGDASLR